jgi:LPS-assembly protein
VALAWCGVPLAALAQTDAPSAWDAPPALRRSLQLQEALPADVRPQLPVFVSGDRITGQPDVKAVIDGNAELRRGDTMIRADRLEYTVPDDLAKAQGSVRINKAGNTYDGSALELRVDAFQG